MLKLLGWIFNLTNRYRAEVDKFDEGLGGKFISLLSAFIFGGLAVGGTYTYINLFYNPLTNTGSDVLANALLLFLLGALVVMLYVAMLDHTLCFIYVGLRGLFTGDGAGAKFSSFLFVFIHIALCAVVFAAGFFLARDAQIIFG